MKPVRSIDSRKRMRGCEVREMEETSVLRRPRRSPVFQKRKASGMKQAGLRRRGAVDGG